MNILKSDAFQRKRQSLLFKTFCAKSVMYEQNQYELLTSTEDV